MKEIVKKVLNKFSLSLFVGAAMVMVASIPTSAEARSSWYVSFSTGPVWVAPARVYYPAPVVRCRPVYYYEEACYPCPPAAVYYPAPVISVGYYSGFHDHHHRYRR